MTTVITKSQFARLAGVSAAAVTKQLAGSLQDALTEGGIDIESPTAIQYLSQARVAGRNPGSAQEEIAMYVVSRFTELEELTAEKPSPQVKKIGDVLFYIGFAHKRMGGRERNDLISQIERGLKNLREERQS